jgi:Emfourin
MKISFETGGGLAGTHASIVLETNSMSDDEGKQIRDLVKNSNFFDFPSKSIPPKAGSADYINYKITVKMDEKEHTIRTNDVSMPSQLKPLVDFLYQKLISSGKEPF